MTDPITQIILRRAPRDPRNCQTATELVDTLTDMQSTAREYDRYAAHLRDGVPGVLTHLQRDIARVQLSQIRRIGGKL